MAKEVYLERSAGWLVHGKPFAEWGSIKPYMRYLTHEWLDDMDDFEQPSGWRLSTEGILKAQQLGYTINIEGVIIPNATDLPDLKAKMDAAFTADKEARKKREEEERQKKAEEAARIKAKIDGWKAGKKYAPVSESDIRYTTIETHYYWQHISGSKFDELIRFTAPPELDGVEGVHVANHDYDTHYDSYMLPDAIADKMTAIALEKKVASLKECPNVYVMKYIWGIIEGNQPDWDYENHYMLPLDVIQALDLANPSVQETMKQKYRADRIARCQTAMSCYVEDIDKWLGIETEIEKIVAKNKAEQAERDRKLREEIEKSNEARVAEARKRAETKQTKYNEIKAQLEKKSKPTLLTEYAQYCGNVFMKSWEKRRIVDRLANRLADETVQSGGAVKIAIIQQANEIEEYPDYDY